ncbi:hypothetical protein [Aureibacter tunicatorum]|uniref:Uncharacterized protein n=1 Tax=Aureibacter tunicatorum TaxID=866807 RepID=A0AAE3XL90_9BACT|nr:hypothetical protein [Aureibacter tunicatorum]MDR6238005.1 hypothetical protein [Aureibacter tunicatorum]BDD03038.1 hypothetical protein AUTU_05210 [Aureibacter tunicatorum]
MLNKGVLVSIGKRIWKLSGKVTLWAFLLCLASLSAIAQNPRQVDGGSKNGKVKVNDAKVRKSERKSSKSASKKKKTSKRNYFQGDGISPKGQKIQAESLKSYPNRDKYSPKKQRLLSTAQKESRAKKGDRRSTRSAMKKEPKAKFYASPNKMNKAGGKKIKSVNTYRADKNAQTAGMKKYKPKGAKHYTAQNNFKSARVKLLSARDSRRRDKKNINKPANYPEYKSQRISARQVNNAGMKRIKTANTFRNARLASGYSGNIKYVPASKRKYPNRDKYNPPRHFSKPYTSKDYFNMTRKMKSVGMYKTSNKVKSYKLASKKVDRAGLYLGSPRTSRDMERDFMANAMRMHKKYYKAYRLSPGMVKDNTVSRKLMVKGVSKKQKSANHKAFAKRMDRQGLYLGRPRTSMEMEIDLMRAAIRQHKIMYKGYSKQHSMNQMVRTENAMQKVGLYKRKNKASYYQNFSNTLANFKGSVKVPLVSKRKSMERNNDAKHAEFVDKYKRFKVVNKQAHYAAFARKMEKSGRTVKTSKVQLWVDKILNTMAPDKKKSKVVVPKRKYDSKEYKIWND